MRYFIPCNKYCIKFKEGVFKEKISSGTHSKENKTTDVTVKD